MFPEIIAYEDSLIKQFRAMKFGLKDSILTLCTIQITSLTCAKNHIPSVFEKFELFVKNHSSSYPKL